ncbi:hypothetical protein BTR14_00010 [Rhizobium rhizosphaerae]|uniref:Uncharacterized protein n=1 Tax=Xaviernesmea rhizosphaerae TaxID=1672749 RepID=A0ABX3PHD1_9HYPH|nr:hypothetical protein [Xaviernesmea rhizosphaerae]OQP87920.1 hypothetical protein BTR14_00010 [Xaviernesmea rhizosphaerae]
MMETPFVYKLTQLRLILSADVLLQLLRKANFNPDEPRIPAGQPGGGRWTDSATLPASYQTTDYVDLRKEEGKLGAHTIEKHVGKTDAELLAGMGPSANRWWPPVTCSQ